MYDTIMVGVTVMIDRSVQRHAAPMQNHGQGSTDRSWRAGVVLDTREGT
jgi:hypothetical protein